MRLRASSLWLRFLHATLATGLASGCLLAAYSFQFLTGPQYLLRQWPDYARDMAAREPDREEHWLQRIVDLSPRDSPARIRLALIAEWRGDLTQARDRFAHAASGDARFRAQWSQLEFLSRHAGAGDPWPTARRCFRMSHGDRRALLDTVWRLRPDGPFLLSQIIPDSAPVLFYTTLFFMEQGELASARAALARLLPLPFASESRANAGRVATASERTDLGLDLTDLHLDRRDFAAAVAIWHSLAKQHFLPVDGAAEAGREVMNPRFRTVPLGRGFDWRRPPAAKLEMGPTSQGWRVEMSPHPPDSAALLHQRVLLARGALPRVQIRATAPDWVRARLLDERTGRPLAGPLTQPQMAHLLLEYARPPGRPPLREPLVIHEVHWSRRP